jgi:hypothetical protein
VQKAVKNSISTLETPKVTPQAQVASAAMH